MSSASDNFKSLDNGDAVRDIINNSLSGIKPIERASLSDPAAAAELAAGAGLIGAGTFKGTAAIERAMKPLQIGVTYGSSPLIGSGHKEPALAVLEKLKEIKAEGRVPDFDIVDLERKPTPDIPRAASGKPIHGGFFTAQQKRTPLDGLVSTGWGVDYKAPVNKRLMGQMPITERLAYLKDAYTPVSVAPGGWLGIQNDVGTPGTQWHGYTHGGPASLASSPTRKILSKLGIRDTMLSWGPSWYMDYDGAGHWTEPNKIMRGRVNRFHLGDAMPSINEGVMDTMRNVVDGKHVSTDESLKGFYDALKSKRALAISGGGGGVSVMERALAAARELKARGIAPDAMHIAAFRAGDSRPIEKVLESLNSTKWGGPAMTMDEYEALKPYLSEIKRLPRNEFAGATASADLHWTYPGASSIQETLMSPNSSVIDTFTGVGVNKKSVDHAIMNAQEAFRHQGVGKATNIKDIVDQLVDHQNVGRTAASARATAHIKDAEMSSGLMKEQLANLIRRQGARKPLMLAGRLAGSAALAVPGILAARDAMKKKSSDSGEAPVIGAAKTMIGGGMLGLGASTLYDRLKAFARDNSNDMLPWLDNIRDMRYATEPEKFLPNIRELVSHTDNAISRAAQTRAADVGQLRARALSAFAQHAGITDEDAVAKAITNMGDKDSLYAGVRALGHENDIASRIGNERNFKNLTRSLVDPLAEIHQSTKGLRRVGGKMILPALALGTGTALLMRKSSAFDPSEDIPAPVSALAGIAATDQGLRAIESARNKNVLVTYGDMGELGGGHANTAKQIRQTLQRIANTTPELKGMKIHDGGMNMDGRHMRNASLAGKRYIASVDPGWGVSDDFRNNRRFMTDGWQHGNHESFGETFGIDPATGETTGNKSLANRIHRKIMVHPDAMGDRGYEVEGIINRTEKLGRKDYSHIWYGTKDPLEAKLADKSGTSSLYTGLHHPFVGLPDAAPLDRKLYAQKVLGYLDEYAPGHGNTLDDLLRKKIFTVSGATRGDTVGIRSRQMYDAAIKGGLDPKDFLVLGIGSGGMDRERLVAGSKAIIGGRPGGATNGGPADFIGLAHNSDLHYGGLGGSSPPEFMAHGGAPLVIPRDEQVFMASGPGDGMFGTGSRAYIDPNQGMFKEEVDRIKELKSRIGTGRYSADVEKAIGQLTDPAPRDWMNTRIDSAGRPAEQLHGRMPTAAIWGNMQDPKAPMRWAEGLDGTREMLSSYGVKSVNGADDLAEVIKDVDYAKPERWRDAAKSVAEGLSRSNASAENSMRKILLEGRNAAKLKALAHGGVGGALGLLSLLHSVSTIKNTMNKAAATSDEYIDGGVGLAKGTILAGLGARQFNQYHKIDKASKELDKVVDDAMGLMGSDGVYDIKQYGKSLDDYARTSEKLLNLEAIPGIKAKSIMTRLPLASILDTIRIPEHVDHLGKFVKSRDMGLFEKIKAAGDMIARNGDGAPAAFNRAFRYGSEHYGQFGKGRGLEALLYEGTSGFPSQKEGAEWAYKHLKDAHGTAAVSKLSESHPSTSADLVGKHSDNLLNDTLGKRFREIFLGEGRHITDKTTGKTHFITRMGDTTGFANFARKTGDAATDGIKAAIKSGNPSVYASAGKKIGKVGKIGSGAVGAIGLGLGAKSLYDLLELRNRGAAPKLPPVPQPPAPTLASSAPTNGLDLSALLNKVMAL